MNLDLLREIIDLVAASGVSEIEIEEEGVRIVVRKDAPPSPYGYVPQAHPMVFAAGTQAPEAISSSTSGESVPSVVPGTEIRAPIVGTFYTASSPEAEPFVSVGSVVKPGDVLCIIEAMKLMNEIESEVSGTVRQVLVDNAKPVEFDQPLFVIETNS
jgi:acetyl-CoA carboxylase biotin carboxyl carrier protein